MIKNYILVAIRNMSRYKGYTFINIVGLAIGMTCCLFITLWIVDELSYDTFHRDSDAIYQVLLHDANRNTVFTSTPIPLALTLKKEIPEIIYATRYKTMEEALLSHGDKMFYEDGMRIVDGDFFNIFSFPFLAGDPLTALDNIHSIVISESIARKYFGDTDPLGKVLTANHERDYIVSGVIQNVPHNSTLQFDMVIRYEFRILNSLERTMDPNVWGWWTTETFLKIQEDTSIDELNTRLAPFVKKHDDKENVSISLMLLTKRNFFLRETDTYIIIFSIIAVFILGIACINYMCLSTARSEKRAGEIGIRKSIGANRNNIIIQFLTESSLLTLIALVITLMCTSLLLPVFNMVTEKIISIDAVSSWTLLLIFVGLVLVTALVSGSYPAFYLASLKPTAALATGAMKVKSTGSLLRKVLVILQFSISIFLIIGTGTVYRQLEYMKKKDIGYSRDHLLTISLRGDSREYYTQLKDTLMSDERILGVTASYDDLPYFGGRINDVDWEGKDPSSNVWAYYNYVDRDFFETVGVDFIEGSGFSREAPDGTEYEYIVNEEMANIMGTPTTVGRILQIEEYPGTIVGVTRNVHIQPFTNQLGSLVFFLDPQQINYMLIRIRSDDVPSTLRFIKETWEKTLSSYPFEHRFVNELFEGSYTGIQRMSYLLNIFACIAILIACLGLYGLSSFISGQRSKEIGVRKALGASVSGITLTLTGQFIRWVLIAILFAWPIGWFTLNKWLQNFAYHIDIEWWIFVSAGSIALGIALFTVSFQSLKAALANPVDSLRYE